MKTLGVILSGCLLLSGVLSGCKAKAPHTDPDGRANGGDSSVVDAYVPVGARLNGVVWGPHPAQESPLFPVAGAAVIAYDTPPEPIPPEVYCEPCMDLPPGVPYTYSAPDGSFGLEVTPGRSYYLTVQKGQFRRVRQYAAPANPGDYDVDAALTTLPSRTDDVAGDTIPRIALVYGDYDHIEDVFAKVGMGDQDGAYGLAWGSEAGVFDVYDNSGPGEDGHGASLNNLIQSPATMSSYHVIVFACSYNANFNFMQDGNVQQNMMDYVWEGGKLYVSDYAMPVVEIPGDWRTFAWFDRPLQGGCNENDFPPSCNHGPPFDAAGEVPDQEMADWLDAMGHLDGLLMRENWDTIGDVDQGFVGFDPEHGTGPNNELYLEPKVWVQGPWDYEDQDLIDFGFDPSTWDMSPHPFTISWPYNCGRVLFTTYHTVGSTQGGRHPGLLPQEMILFYLIMEMTVCQDIPVVR